MTRFKRLLAAAKVGEEKADGLLMKVIKSKLTLLILAIVLFLFLIK